MFKGKLYQLLVVSLLLTVVLCSQPFSVSVGTSEKYEVGDKIMCQFTITNNLEKDLYLLSRNTPLEGLKSNYITVFLNKTQRVLYDGIFMKRGVPTMDEIVLVLAHKSVMAEVDISSSYSLHQSGIYTIQFDSQLTFTDSSNSTDLKKFISQRVKSENSIFKLVKLGRARKPRLPMGELHRQMQVKSFTEQEPTVEKLFASGPLTPSFKGYPSSRDISDAKTAYAYAFKQVRAAETVVYSDVSYYVKWFGTLDYRSTVKGNFQSLENVMSSAVITFDFSGSDCKTNTFAYTYHGARTIYLCPAYKYAPLSSGSDTKFGTMVHEMTHAIVYTNDITYGSDGCQELAMKDPAKAIQNADNYEYFVEGL